MDGEETKPNDDGKQFLCKFSVLKFLLLTDSSDSVHMVRDQLCDGCRLHTNVAHLFKKIRF